MVSPHILLVTYPAQGHINPALQLAKRLVGLGVRVTFSTSIGAQRSMAKIKALNGLSFASYTDGHDDGYHGQDNLDHYMLQLRLHGFKSLSQIIETANANNNTCPFTCVVYSILIPWVAAVAREHRLPSIYLWNQPAALLSIYYHYFNGYKDMIEKHINDPSFSLKLPGLPSLKSLDLPSFFVSNEHPFALPLLKEELDVLDQEIAPKVLLNTFDELESDVLESFNKYKLRGVGPLIPSAFLDGKDPSDTSFGGDLFKESTSYIEWLNSKAEFSVIYISFGSISVLSKQQKEEMAKALIHVGHPFLWVIRDSAGEDDELINYKEELKQQGIKVPWCSQVGVLSHSSIGCFVTHCGWNSTFESIASGVPMVGFPQWTDQFTNAKMVEDVWKTGVRARGNEGVVKAEEISKCMEMVMGDRGGEMRNNAKKWKKLATEAAGEGGSSYNNLKNLVLSL